MPPRKKIERSTWVETPTPYQMCQRYASGALTKDELVDYLGAYAYAPRLAGLEVDDELLIFTPSSWTDVDAALAHGLIDEAIYARSLDLFASA